MNTTSRSATRIRLRPLAAPALGLALLLAPSRAPAQVGITGSALGPSKTEVTARSSPFDRGLQSKSALGQLQEMAGRTVDTSKSPAPRVAPPQPRSVPRPPSLNLQQQMAISLTGALLEGVLMGVLQDDSAERAAAAAAEAARIQAEKDAATAEAFRAHQRAVANAQAQQAQRYRADWDEREREVSAQMEGVFSLAATPPGGGTGFFGEPAGPSADVLAAILGPIAADAAATEDGVGSGSDAVALDADSGAVVSPSVARGLVEYFADDAASRLKDDFLGGVLESTLWGFAENLPGQEYAKALSDFDSNRKEMTQSLGDPAAALVELAIGGSDTVRMLALPGADGRFAEAYWTELGRRTRELVIAAWSLAYGSATAGAEAPDLRRLGIFDDGN